jgi:dTDP-4-amino-4,6-dideoxygalactose transaminase
MTEWQAAVLLSQLARFPDQLAAREASVRYLDGALARIPGIRTTLRREQITRQGLYGYVIRYDREAFDDLPGAAFQEALSAELGVPIKGPYEPLNDSPLLQPHTKRRHHLSPEYRQRIDPGQYSLPVAERAYGGEASIIPHEFLLLPTAQLELLPAAIERIRRHLGALLDRQRATAA